jgi:phenylacetate-CoA ligase
MKGLLLLGASIGLYTALCSGVLFPLHEKIKRHHSAAVRRRLEAQERWQAERLDAWRVERLKEFLTAVGAGVPYYRDLFARIGFDPSRVAGIPDLQRLPLIDKAAMRAAGDRMKADGARGLSRYNTGGSSGEPLIFYIGRERRSHDVGAKWRATRWWDVDIGDRELVVWGSPIELGAQDRLRRWRDRFFRSELLPAFEMSPDNLDRFVEIIRERRPAMLFGYPSSLSLIAGHARGQGIRMDDLGIRVAFVTSEVLYEEQRALIAEVFGCPVANGYGARDAGFIAHECPQGGMHLQAEDIIVEIIDGEGRVLGPGEPGEIVVTHTATRDFPFLRYRTGDIGVLSGEPCPCGRTLPLLQEIQGRTTDFVVSSQGTVMHGLALIYPVRDLPGVERFKIIQHSLHLTEILLVARPPFGVAEEARLVQDYKARLGDDVTVRVTRVDHLPAEKSGKYRYLVSKLATGEFLRGSSPKPIAPEGHRHPPPQPNRARAGTRETVPPANPRKGIRT